MPSKTISLSPTAIELLAKQSNASAYLDRLVQREHADVVGALISLQGSGWEPAVLLALCDILNGYAHVPSLALSQAIPMEMGDTEPAILSKYRIKKERWAEATKAAGSEATALQLWRVVQAYWGEHAVVIKKLKP